MKKYVFVSSLIVNLIFIALLVRHFINRPEKNTMPSISYVVFKNKIFDKMPIDSNESIFVGDSHIQNFEVSELFHSLLLKNRGVNGESSSQLLNSIDTVVKGKPSKIFIEIGTNDLFQKIPMDSIIKNYKFIIKKIHSKSPNTIVYLQSVIANRFDLGQCSILNKKIHALADSRHLIFIDLNPYFLDNGLKAEYDSGDGAHLNGAGYLKWRDVLKPYLQ